MRYNKIVLKYLFYIQNSNFNIKHSILQFEKNSKIAMLKCLSLTIDFL
jgi:hypothetical protein